MSANKKPRKKYRPKPVVRNPIAYVMESLKPIQQHDSYWLDLQLKNSQSMSALFQGRAQKPDMDVLIAMHNVCEALWRMGKGVEYGDVLIRGKAALLDVGRRGVTTGRFILKAPEMQALNDLMELHDAQMEISTVGDLEKALAIVNSMIRAKKAIPVNVPESVKQ